MVHEGYACNPTAVVQRATKLLQGSREAFQPVRDRGMVDPPVGLPHAVMAWVPPPMNCFKVNWEVYKDSATKMWTAGILIRNHGGHVLAAQCVHV